MKEEKASNHKKITSGKNDHGENPETWYLAYNKAITTRVRSIKEATTQQGIARCNILKTTTLE